MYIRERERYIYTYLQILYRPDTKHFKQSWGPWPRMFAAVAKPAGSSPNTKVPQAKEGFGGLGFKDLGAWGTLNPKPSPRRSIPRRVGGLGFRAKGLRDYKSPTMGYNYGYPTYNPTYEYPWASKHADSCARLSRRLLWLLLRSLWIFPNLIDPEYFVISWLRYVYV